MELLTIIVCVVGLVVGMFISKEIAELFSDEPNIGIAIRIVIVVMLLLFAFWNEGGFN